jgi:hypothetical protein
VRLASRLLLLEQVLVLQFVQALANQYHVQFQQPVLP